MKKKFISFILSFMLIALGLLPSNVMAEGFNSSDEFNYIGYQEGGIGNIRKLAVVDKETNDNKRIVYCFNKEYHWPGGIRDINGFAYKKTTGDVVSFQNHVNEKSKYKGEKLINALKIILTQGYPNGKIIQKSLNLSDDKYREITQMAVWHFTDGQYINIGQLQSLPKDEEALALSILLTNAKSEILDNDVLDYYLKAYQDKQPTYQIPEEIEKIPENSTLDLYISNGVTQADGKQYQNLLGANLINKNTKEIIPIENSNQKETTVKFSKQDLAGNELKGATITLTGNNGDKQTWESDGKTKAKEFTVKEGKYTFTETAAPEGYKLATEIKFEVVRNKETQKLEIQNVEVGTGNKEGADGLLIMVDDYKEKETVVKFSKQDLAGNELKGATITLTGNNGDKQTWESDGKTKAKEFTVKEGKYTFTETAAPEGYKIATEIKFEVVRNKETQKLEIQNVEVGTGNKEGADGLLIMVDDYKEKETVVKFSKQDLAGNELKGATITLTGNNGDKQTWESDGKTKAKEFTVKEGKYTFTETAAPEGYKIATEIKFEVVRNKTTQKLEIQNVEVGTGNKEGADGLLIMVDDYKTKNVFFSKQDVLGKELPGAHLAIKNVKTGQVVKEWISGETPETFGLVSGHYEMVETIAPEGHKVATSIAFEITKKGEVKVDKKHLKTVGSNQIIVMVDDYKTKNVFFSKQDVLGKELSGAHLAIKNVKTGQVVKEWISGETPETFGLVSGHYEMVETIAPEGHKVATSIAFEINKKGEIKVDKKHLKTVGSNQIIVMVDDYKTKNVFFSKQDVLGKELPGAHLAIKNVKTGKVVKEWISGETPETFSLVPGKYQMIETIAPEGHKVATSIAFEITKDLKVKIADETLAKKHLKKVKSNQIIVMVDDYKTKNVFFSKQDVLGKELPGAHLAIKNLSTGQVVKEWISGETPETFSLVPGSYEMVETIAPEGHKVATSIAFEITKDLKVKIADETLAKKHLKKVKSNQIIVMVDDYKNANIFFSKQDVLGKELPGAHLEIRDVSTGKVVKEWISGETPETFGFQPGQYEMVETIAPEGHKVATSIAFEITKKGEVKVDKKHLKTVGSNPIIVMVDDYKNANIFFSKQDVLGKELPGAHLEIRDVSTGKVVKEWISGETPETFGFQPGQYEMVETIAPEGYKVATSIAFEITANKKLKVDKKHLKTVGSNQIIVMVDDYEKAPTPTPETVSISVRKVWNTNEDISGKSATIVLNQTGASLVLSAANGWTGSFTDLPKYNTNGELIQYTISEQFVEGYTAAISGSMSGGYVVTNTKDETNEPTPETINIPVQKVWSVKEGDIIPQSITVTLSPTGETLVLSAANDWKGQFNNLPTMNEAGERITYSISEVGVPGYLTEITGNMMSGFTVVNTSLKPEEPKQEEPKPEEPKQEEPKQKEPKQEEPKQEEPKPEEPKQEEPKQEEPKQEKLKPEEPKKSTPKKQPTLPRTGEASNGFLYGAATVLAGLGIFGTVAFKKMNENE